MPVLIALAHDILITAGVYALADREVTTSTVAALLTILGYSLYDTIIVFDRIRENVPRMPRATFSQIVNRSMSEVLTRSLATSFCTLMPVGALMLFGGETLQDFAFALLVGIASGAYSSIFIASPVLVGVEGARARLHAPPAAWSWRSTAASCRRSPPARSARRSPPWPRPPRAGSRPRGAAQRRAAAVRAGAASRPAAERRRAAAEDAARRRPPRRRSRRRPSPLRQTADARRGAARRPEPTAEPPPHRLTGTARPAPPALPARGADAEPKPKRQRAAQEAREALAMSMLVWVMMGIAIWHFTVFVPDRFWGGIVGAFLAAILGAVIFGFVVAGFTVPGKNDTDLVQALIAIPGALIALGHLVALRARAVDAAHGVDHGPHPRGLALAGRTHRVPSGAGPTIGRMPRRPRRWSCDARIGRRRASPAEGARAVLRRGAILVRRGHDDAGRRRGASSTPTDRHDPLSLPGLPEAARADPAATSSAGSRIVVLRRLRRRRRLLDGDARRARCGGSGRSRCGELPSRFDEGYGLSVAAVERLAAAGDGLLVTVDCGITAVEEVARRARSGIEVVVTDHHRPGERAARLPGRAPGARRLPVPRAVRGGRGATSSSEALARGRAAIRPERRRTSTWSALATVCDLVPLRGENRRIVARRACGARAHAQARACAR